jgi:hypothetical protein
MAAAADYWVYENWATFGPLRFTTIAPTGIAETARASRARARIPGGAAGMGPFASTKPNKRSQARAAVP